MKKIFLLFLFILAPIFAQENLSSLLSDFAQKADLSNKTKQESAGFLIVYTRQDLDRMNIHYLKDIIDKIPFLRYNEDNGGMTSPFYHPYQPEPADAIRVYINDRELITPFSGNTLKLFGQMSMGYIDHIEVYLGVPSQTLGIPAAWVVIKCYTKDPKRENTDLIGVQAGSYGTKEAYGYSAKNLQNFSYLVYLNSRNSKREKVYYENNSLSRNKDITNFYGEIQKNNFRFEMQASKGSLDNFIGSTINFDPKQNYTDYDYFYTGVYYKNDTLKAFINYSQDRTDHYISSKTYLGVIPLSTYPYLYYYPDARTKINEKVSDAQVYKTFKTEKNKLIVGVQSRYKYFNIKEMRRGDIEIPNSIDYSRELILSGFIENSYLIDNSKMLTASIKYDKTYENGKIKDYNTLSGRIGYIYNSGKWVSKTFAFVGETTPSMQTLFQNRVIYHQQTDPDKERKVSIDTKIIYNGTNFTTSFLIGRTASKDTIYFDAEGYKNLRDTYITDTASFRHTYIINPLNKIIFNAWCDNTYKKGRAFFSGAKYYGGLLTMYNTIGKFDFYNNITYKHWEGIKN
ncbi:MAG: hypothetical protein GXO12_05555, partial [Epsilonproteobacteria bacterium]|nr:hypothetical protein [Campylobacterota bacterium]